MPGTAYAGTCYSSQAEAAAMWCAGTSGVVSGGVLSCQAITTALPTTTGGLAVFSWTRRTVPSSGSTISSSVSGQQLQSCEPYDFAYYSPMLGAFIAAAAAVACGRWVYRLFTQDRETM